MNPYSPPIETNANREIKSNRAPAPTIPGSYVAFALVAFIVMFGVAPFMAIFF